MTSHPDVVSDALAELAALAAEVGVSVATLVTYRGETIAEQYASTVSASTRLISWSMAKTVVQALVGVCVRHGILRLDQPAPIPEWANDQRASITIEHLLQMSSGLRFAEDYIDAGASDAIEMLFGSGRVRAVPV